MAFLIRSQGVGRPPVLIDLLATHGPYKVGRWCKAPDEPDRCYFCPLADVKPATGYVVRDGWRHGHCQACTGKATHWQP